MSIKRVKKYAALIIGFFLILCIPSCASQKSIHPKSAYSLKILHINDTHSHIDPEEWTINIDGINTKIQLGGFTRLVSALQEGRRSRENTLFLHGGDVFQGTLYFVKYEGRADLDFLNLMKLDALAAGNHEYDRGPDHLAGFIREAQFPVVSANTRIAERLDLKKRVMPYVIKEIGGQRIGIIGLTTPETGYKSNPGGEVTFSDPVESTKRYIREMERQGINKIIVLSHLGFEKDRDLAQNVSSIDLIVGGHSHTLLGDFSRYGLTVSDPYPWIEKGPDGKKVLIVQAWEWAKVLGRIKLSFDEAGDVLDYQAGPELIVGRPFKQRWKDTNGDGRIDDKDLYLEVTPEESPERYRNIVRFIGDGEAVVYEENGTAKNLRDRYAVGIDELKKTVVAKAAENLNGSENDTGAGPLIADAMLWKTRPMGAQIAIENPGAVRGDIPSGDVTVGRIYELLPFRNTLVLIDLSDQEIINVLEEAIEMSKGKMGYGTGKYVYLSGLKCRVDLSKPTGERISDVLVEIDGTYQKPVGGKTYRIVTNSFLAAGGDRYLTFKKARSKEDTGLIDVEVFLDYIKKIGVLKNIVEKRVIME